MSNKIDNEHVRIPDIKLAITLDRDGLIERVQAKRAKKE